MKVDRSHKFMDFMKNVIENMVVSMYGDNVLKYLI